MNCNCSNTPGEHPHSDSCSQSPPPLEGAAPAEPRAPIELTPEQLASIRANLQAIFTANGQQMDAESITNLFVNVTAQEERKKQRVKVYANGFFMTFDKVSSCHKRHFWRCEFKNTCNARIHTDTQRKTIINSIHTHNHPPVADEELRLYGLDPATLEKGTLYIVDNTADSNQRRRIRKKAADEEATRKWNEMKSRQPGTSSDDATSGSQPSTSSSSSSAAAAAAAKFPTADFNFSAEQLLAATTAGITTGISSMFSNRLLPKLASVPSPQPAVVADAPTLDMAKKLRVAWQGQPSRHPRSTETPTRHFKFYISQNNGSDEHLYMPMHIDNRDDGSLKSALEVFLGKKLTGSLVLEVGPKIKLVVNQQTIQRWENDQFFLIDASNPEQWTLKYTDDLVV